MEGITICVAEKADAALIADLSRQTFYETFAPVNTKENMDQFMNETFTKEALMNEAGAKGNIFLIAFDQKMPVGYVRMRESENPVALGDDTAIEIARIYAINSSIGTGVGKLMMLKCIEMAKELKKKMIWLGVWEKNQRAINFYTKWGFEKFGEQKFILGNEVQIDWLMKKKL